MDNPPSVDPFGGKDNDDGDGSEVEDDKGMDDHFGHLYNLAEAAYLVDFYYTNEDIVPLLEDITLHENGLTPNNSPRKHSHL